jgi:predicted dehydrogenase
MRRREFYPDADAYTDFRDLLDRRDIEVVDITTHPPQRGPLIEAAITAGKHVLSQKPFVVDLDQGERLVDLADRHGVLLAVNQNGRWAPHFSYLRNAVAAGLIGTITAAHFGIHWDHSWVAGTEFENVRHLILYDFAIHWFDMLTCLMDASAQQTAAVANEADLSSRPVRVYASFVRSPSQKVKPALFGQALVEYQGAQATLVFDGATQYAPLDSTYVAGTRGTIISQGPDIHNHQVTLTTAEGTAQPDLHGDWFPDGFHGTMGELLTAIEQRRQPAHSARNNLASLQLCFAAVASAERHEAIVPGTVRQMPQ